MSRKPMSERTVAIPGIECPDGFIPRSNLLERFWSKVNKTDSCWEWTGLKLKGRSLPYGQITAYGKTYYTHRLSWIIHNGQIPDGKFILHSCDNPPCVNPAHLRAGTIQENNADRILRGRWAHGQTHSRANLTDKDVLEIRKLYQPGVYRRGTRAAIAKLYGVSPATITLIVARTTWRHI